MNKDRLRELIAYSNEQMDHHASIYKGMKNTADSCAVQGAVSDADSFYKSASKEEKLTRIYRDISDALRWYNESLL